MNGPMDTIRTGVCRRRRRRQTIGIRTWAIIAPVLPPGSVLGFLRAVAAVAGTFLPRKLELPSARNQSMPNSDRKFERKRAHKLVHRGNINKIAIFYRVPEINFYDD